MNVRRKISLAALATLLVGTGCASLFSSGEASRAIFENPAAFADREVRLCGFIHARFEDMNIWPSQRQAKLHEIGLGLLPPENEADQRRLKVLDGRTTCINAKIVWTGCWTGDVICNWTQFEYAAQVLP